MMKRKTQRIDNVDNMVDDEAAIRAFFAHLGLDVEVVDRCPVAACEHCSEPLDEAA